jgi:hypothetical protein
MYNRILNTAMGAEAKRDVRPEVTKEAGRPRAVTLANILDAAIELGLARITMAGIAAKLGVGAARVAMTSSGSRFCDWRDVRTSTILANTGPMSSQACRVLV